MYNPLDPRQLTRIEAVHRGFLYQHLYAVGCLLLAGHSGVRAIIVELDEDVELEYDNGDRRYLQIKTRSGPLIQSDIDGALARFERIRLEHAAGRRCGTPSFAIVANVPPGRDLATRVADHGLPGDTILVTPNTSQTLPAGMPPAWFDVAQAVAWCAEHARSPMAMLEPETLVWKLAGRVLLAATGQGAGHGFETADLPALFERLVIQLQQFPLPPQAYRPLENEPELARDSRIRIVTGFSGAGKTAWASRAAMHLGSECAYFDVGDLPGPAIAASLVRELAAQWAAPTAGGLRQVLLPGATGIEALRALDRFVHRQGARALVVLDNAHRVPAADLRTLFDATHHLRFVLLAQPAASIIELEAGIALSQELLHGWGLDQVAAEADAHQVRASAPTLGRVLALTGGLPLYVRTAMQLCVTQYGGDAAAMAASIEANTNLVQTAQELILTRSLDILPPAVQDCVAVLSLSDVPLSQDESAKLVTATFGLSEADVVAAIRHLRPLGVVRTYGGQRLQVHDAFRVLGLRRYAGLPVSQAAAGRTALKELILASLEQQREHARFPLLIRTLVELGELEALVDVATEEWFHELGIDAGIWAALEAATDDTSISAEQRFHALDGLVFADMKGRSLGKVAQRLDQMERLVEQNELDARAKLVVVLKRIAFDAESGNVAAVRTAIEHAKTLAPDEPEHQRVLRYNIAQALYVLGLHAEAEALARPLVDEYLDHLGLTSDGIIGKSSDQITAMLRQTSTLLSDTKHLADCLDVLARSANAQGRHGGYARIHALKFYQLANALDSYIKVGQDLVDEFLMKNESKGARQLIEDHLLPVVLEHQLLDKVVPVRSQYAVVLAYCGEHAAAMAEFARLVPYRPGLNRQQLEELNNQMRLVARLQLARR